MKVLVSGVLLAAGICFIAPRDAALAQEQAAAPQQDVRGAGTPVKLADLLAEAERNHPAIQAARRMAESKRAQISQARAFPDPQVSVGYMGSLAPFRTHANDPSSGRQFGVMQEIPYPGQRELRGKIAAKEADAEARSIEAERRRVRASVKVAYFELAAAQKSLELTRKNRELLEKIARIAEEKYKVGEGTQADVLRAQVEVTRVQQRLMVLEQKRRTLEAQLNSLLVRPVETPLGEVEALEKVPLNYSLEELLEKGVANSPEVQQQEDRIEQSRLAAALAERERRPEFSIGWDYVNRTSGHPEMYGLKFTVSLPFFNQGWRRDQVSAAAASEAGARHLREAIRTQLMFQVQEQHLAARTSEELMALYARALVPQAALTLESSLAAYQAGKLDFMALLGSFLSVLEYETSYYEELANYRKALARIEELTGVAVDEPQALSGGEK
jgi:outer membrane protein TolC